MSCLVAEVIDVFLDHMGRLAICCIFSVVRYIVHEASFGALQHYCIPLVMLSQSEAISMSCSREYP